MKHLTFANPELLWLLLIIPIILIRYYRSRRSNQAQGLQISFVDKLSIQSNSFPPTLLFLILRIAAILFLVIAICRPVKKEQVISFLPKQQVSIMFAVDVSNSMLAQDLQPNRLEALKDIAREFIDRRRNDRMGLVVYAGESFTACPLTDDHQLLKGLLKDANSSFLPDGTAIGMGLLSAINRLRNSDTAGKVVILFTDGENNAGSVSPLKAAEIASKYGIKVYTVGIGTVGKADYPTKDAEGKVKLIKVPVSIDEKTLNAVAAKTNGRYFRAKNNHDLNLIYQEISKEEEVESQLVSHEQQQEYFLPLAFAALALIAAEIIFRYTILKQFA